MKNRLLSILFFIVITISLCHAQNPTLWGMTSQGGANDSGVIFNYNTSTGKEIDVHDFMGGTDGANPYGSLLKANNGLLYGMTYSGGTYDSGTIFSYNILTGTEAILHDFGGGTDGQWPMGSLIQANNGLLYGMTSNGGTYGLGTIFSYNILTHTETDIHDFGNDSDGAVPYGSLIQASDGLLYGMTASGGIPYWGGGIIFSYNITTGQETVLYDLGILDSVIENPEGSLIQADNGLLYGMTASGMNDLGNIFSYNISTNKETDLYDFNPNLHENQGIWPVGSLIQASNGLLYGATPVGGPYYGYGVLFSYNIVTDSCPGLYIFDRTSTSNTISNGGCYGSLIQASNGLLYGMTLFGGINDSGTIFSYNISKDTGTDLYDFNGQDGALPYLGNLIEDDTVNAEPLSSSICKGNSIMLTANGATGYTWSPSAGLSATTGDSVIANPTATTTYTMEGTFGTKIITRTVTVTVNPNPIISVNIPSSICSGENTILIASGATTYTWTPSTGLNTTTNDTVIASLTSSITYTVTGTNSLGCSTKVNVVVPVIPSPNKPTITRQGNELTSSATQGNQWELNDTVIYGATNQTYTANQKGCYSVIAENPANGCNSISDTICLTPTGIQQLSNEGNQLSIYPNPSTYIVNVNASKNIDELKVTNLLGQIIYAAKPKQTQFTFNLQETGMYFVTVTEDNETETKKVIVSK